MEAPIDLSSGESDGDGDDGDESFVIPSDIVLEDEVDINIHFHCEHCVKIGRCRERPKPGWSCEVQYCDNGCGHKFHVCKRSEHHLLCSHERVPCINAGYGCPLWMERRAIARHLPFCPASVVVCCGEWNRWILGAKERERVAMTKGITSLYNPTDIDMALALRDQEQVNEMQQLPKRVRTTLCNSITRRFPCLPLTIRGSYHLTQPPPPPPPPCTGEEEEGNTAQGDINNKKHSKEVSNMDDIAAIWCPHQIIKNICNFCREDPDEPVYKMGRVWRGVQTLTNPGEVTWGVESCVEKIRKRNQFGMFTYKKYEESDDDDDDDNLKASPDKLNIIFDKDGQPIGRKQRLHTPPPAPITPKDLTMELSLKHYSTHQAKPKAMFTFQCMQEVRRCEYNSHYQNMHTEIQEGLDGWLVQRCPLHVIGCPFINNRLHPGKKDSNVVYSQGLKAFGVCPNLDYQPANCGGLPKSRSPSVEKTTTTTTTTTRLSHLSIQRDKKNNNRNNNNNNNRNGSELDSGSLSSSVEAAAQYLASSTHLTYLPIEVLQKIATYLDGFSLNNLLQTCRLMREVCLSLLNERGLVIIEWIRHTEESDNNSSSSSTVRWRQGRKMWFFSKAFESVSEWGFKDVTTHMGDHLQVCKFNKRHVALEKFAYILPRKDGTIPNVIKMLKLREVKNE